MSKVNYKKLGNDTIAFGFSNIASKVISYFLLPLYTSVLSTEEFGFADTLLTFVNLLYPILTLSISEALLRFTIDEDDTAKRNEYITVTFGIVALSIPKKQVQRCLSTVSRTCSANGADQTTTAPLPPSATIPRTIYP